MSPDSDPDLVRLRERGLRATSQRRAILNAFAGGRCEHLSADDVHERARRALPDLGRATVYNTLGELVRAGLLSVYGRPEPVRYESEVEPHQHFRCLACRRVYDVYPDVVDHLAPPDDGFVVDRVHLLLEGTCAECAELERALREHQGGDVPREEELLPLRASYATFDSPLGPLLAAASERGLVRVSFEGGRPEDILRGLGSSADVDLVRAPERLAAVRRQLDEYFAGERRAFDLPLDVASVEPAHRRALAAIAEVPYGEVADYRRVTEAVQGPQAGRVAGEALGANPLALVVPCHRVLRADGGLGGYVGGTERKRALLELEGARR